MILSSYRHENLRLWKVKTIRLSSKFINIMKRLCIPNIITKSIFYFRYGKVEVINVRTNTCGVSWKPYTYIHKYKYIICIFIRISSIAPIFWAHQIPVDFNHRIRQIHYGLERIKTIVNEDKPASFWMWCLFAFYFIYALNNSNGRNQETFEVVKVRVLSPPLFLGARACMCIISASSFLIPFSNILYQLIVLLWMRAKRTVYINLQLNKYWTRFWINS